MDRASISSAEESAYQRVIANRSNLLRFLESFEVSVSLFEFLERGGHPPTAGVLGGDFIQWRIVAARDGALNIYHFGCSLKALKQQLWHCPTIAKNVELDLITDAIRHFKLYFPHAKNIRHAIAHAGEMADSPKQMKIGEGKNGLIHALYERKYTIGYLGDEFTVEMDATSTNKLRHLTHMADSAFQARAPRP